MRFDRKEQVVDALRAGTLDLDCGDICLTQEAAPVPRVYQGPGYIRQDENGKLVFKIYPPADGPPIQEAEPLGQPGVLVPPDRFYTFRAIDTRGHAWTGGRVLPDVSVHSAGGREAAVVRGRIHALTTEGTPPPTGATHGLTLRFFTEQEIPCHSATVVETNAADHHQMRSTTLNLATISSCGCDFLLTRGPGELTVEVTAREPLPPHFDTRITETLQFVLARPLQVRVLEQDANGVSFLRLTSPLPLADARLQAPINLRSIKARYWTWVLFDRYLRFTLRHPGEEWHPCSGHLGAVCEASAASIDAEVLALVVAVEGVTKVLFPDLAPIPDAFRSLVAALQAHVRAWLKDNEPAQKANLPDRVQNITGMLLEVRAVDRLEHLARDGVIEKKHIKAWKDLRNAAAHAAAPGTSEWQQQLDRRDVVLALLYRLVFHAIGYEGRFSDYGSRHWPVVAIPERRVSGETAEDGTVSEQVRSFGHVLTWTGRPDAGPWAWSVRWAEGEPAEVSGTANAREEAAATARVCAEKRLIAAIVHEGSGSLT